VSGSSSSGQTETMPDLAPLETTELTEETVTSPVTDDGDHDRFAHYARKADITRAAVEGTPVVAICGKVWVPSRDPSKYPICKTCAEIKSKLDARKHN
jgi:hypothetical protein